MCVTGTEIQATFINEEPNYSTPMRITDHIQFNVDRQDFKGNGTFLIFDS